MQRVRYTQLIWQMVYWLEQELCLSTIHNWVRTWGWQLIKFCPWTKQLVQQIQFCQLDITCQLIATVRCWLLWMGTLLITLLIQLMLITRRTMHWLWYCMQMRIPKMHVLLCRVANIQQVFHKDWQSDSPDRQLSLTRTIQLWRCQVQPIR